MFTKDYADVFAGDERWQSLPTPAGDTFAWDDESTYVRRPPYFDGMPAEPAPVTDIAGARVLAMLGDSVTTDHISPGRLDQGRLPGRAATSPSTASARSDFNSYGSRRGNHEVMIRGTFANIRLRNQLAPGHRGRRDPPPASTASRPRSTTRRSAYAEDGVPLVILAGKEYGSGSSRDWAAKGTALLGVRAVIAESYERIHRSNLIGMGVLPLQFADGESAESLGLTGEETFTITGIDRAQRRRTAARGHGPGRRRRRSTRRGPHRHPRRGGVLPPRRDPAVRPALPPLNPVDWSPLTGVAGVSTPVGDQSTGGPVPVTAVGAVRPGSRVRTGPRAG